MKINIYWSISNLKNDRLSKFCSVLQVLESSSSCWIISLDRETGKNSCQCLDQIHIEQRKNSMVACMAQAGTLPACNSYTEWPQSLERTLSQAQNKVCRWNAMCLALEEVFNSRLSSHHTLQHPDSKSLSVLGWANPIFTKDPDIIYWHLAFLINKSPLPGSFTDTSWKLNIWKETESPEHWRISHKGLLKLNASYNNLQHIQN